VLSTVRAVDVRAVDVRAVDVRSVDRVESWDEAAAGVLRLPSGRLVRGRGLRPRDARGRGLRARAAHGRGAGCDAGPDGQAPQFGLYLLGSRPPAMRWPSRWVRWPDWWLPVDGDDARDAIVETWRRAERGRVEVACGGGRGRTGTVLACLAVLDGCSADDAVDHVRRGYHPRAVETPWQRRWVRRFAAAVPPAGEH